MDRPFYDLLPFNVLARKKEDGGREWRGRARQPLHMGRKRFSNQHFLYTDFKYKCSVLLSAVQKSAGLLPAQQRPWQVSFLVKDNSVIQNLGIL